MFVKLNCGAAVGVDCVKVEVEIDLGRGQTNFNIVGLADTAIQEAKERIHSALKNSELSYPVNHRLLINLAPADLHKEGPAYDLPMAVGIALLAAGLELNLSDALFAGEVGLDGTLRHTKGILPLALLAQKIGLKRLFVPADNASEAGLVNGLEIYPIKTLKQIAKHLSGQEKIAPFVATGIAPAKSNNFYVTDMALIKGQEFAKRALEIAASGNHNVIMVGPPGSGKTLLARALPSILPTLALSEALEVTKIYSVAGLLKDGLVSERPFRSPHHTASAAALVGGGRVPAPGEISLAHRGVLFLDEFPEFPRLVLESLRQPLEDGTVTVARARGSANFPARFLLVASQNPCPCGLSLDPEQNCVCSAAQIINYRKKISGPILDRIDLHVEVPRVKFEKLTETALSESSEKIRARVETARERQRARFAKRGINNNSEMGNAEIRDFCKLNDESLELLRQAVNQLHLSARAFNRVLKVSRTIADLSGAENIGTEHVAEALQFRAKNE